MTALRLAGYARVSTDGQVLQAASIPEQAADLRAWCEEHGHTFVELCAQDDAVSGTEGLEGRLAFIQALDLVKTGEVDGILVRDLDRFGHEARNTDQKQASCTQLSADGVGRGRAQAGDPVRGIPITRLPAAARSRCRRIGRGVRLRRGQQRDRPLRCPSFAGRSSRDP